MRLALTLCRDSTEASMETYETQARELRARVTKNRPIHHGPGGSMKTKIWYASRGLCPSDEDKGSASESNKQGKTKFFQLRLPSAAYLRRKAKVLNINLMCKLRGEKVALRASPGRRWDKKDKAPLSLAPRVETPGYRSEAPSGLFVASLRLPYRLFALPWPSAKVGLLRKQSVSYGRALRLAGGNRKAESKAFPCLLLSFALPLPRRCPAYFT